jgi:hypothetical protein
MEKKKIVGAAEFEKNSDDTESTGIFNSSSVCRVSKTGQLCGFGIVTRP